jgi:integrase
MAAMGRRRKNPDCDLEPRVYTKGAAFYYVHRSGKWEALGLDKEAANRKARHYNDPDSLVGTMIYWMEQFLIDCDARVKLKSTVKNVKLSPRTYADYKSAIVGNSKTPGVLRTYFEAPMTPYQVTPDLVQDFLDDMAEIGNATQGNLARACLSSFFSWLLRKKHCPGLMVNPCMRASGVKRIHVDSRDRYVTHEEYNEVYAVASRSERRLMVLTYRTLQRPESDIVLWDDTVIQTEGGRRYLVFEQHKTGMRMRIAFTADLDAVLPIPEGNVRQLRAPLVGTLNGKHYTYDGISSMLRRSIEVANVRRDARRVPRMPSFGFRDLKGKGATDMYFQAKVPLAQIQQLLGHKNQSTSERYIKARWRETAEPNAVATR